MSDYTPGPWTFVEAGTRGEDGPTYFSISSKEFGWIATTPTYDQTAEANAHLIAAAPDLLTAAEAVLNDAYMPDLISGGHVCLNCNFNLNGGEHHAECPIPALAAAIKKAKGQ